MKIYHGTSKYNWENKYADNSTLFLTSNQEDAANYAYEAAADNEYSKLRPLPIIVSIDIENLLDKDLEFDPDDSCVRSVSDGGPKEPLNVKSLSWEDSIRYCGSFSIFGNIEALKPLFKIEKIGIKKS